MYSAIHMKSIPFRILTDRSMRLVRYLILSSAIFTISISQNMSDYATASNMPLNSIYWFSLISAAAYLAVAYLHIYVLVPRFLAKKEYTSYFFASIVSLIILWAIRMAQNQVAINLWSIDTRPFRSAAVLDSISDFALNLLCFTGVSLSVVLKY